MPSVSGNRPADFDSYWTKTMDEMKQVPPAPEIEAIPLRTTDFATLYGVRLTSIGPYRLFAYLSIPHGSGPFPARYYIPGYRSVHDPIPQGTPNAQRAHYITFSLAARGQRNSDRPFAASFPGLLTEGIDDPSTYIFTGIVADCCRGLEYLTSRPEVDLRRVLTIGNDLSLITAALSPQVTHIVCAPAIFYATADLAPHAQTYPLEEINDYLRLYSIRNEAIQETLSYLDLRWFAPNVKATALLMVGGDGDLLNSKILQPLVQALQGEVEVHKAEHSSYKDGLFQEQWITRQLGLEKPILPEHWQ